MLLLSIVAAHAADAPPPPLVVGLSVGPDVPVAAFGVSALPRLEIGYARVVGPLRLEPFVSGAWTRLSLDGTGTDDAVGGAYNYNLRQDLLQFGAGVVVQPAHALAARIRPEVGVGPLLSYMDALATGAAGDASFGETREHYFRGGVYAELGAALALGPGDLTLQVQLSAAGLAGMLAGSAPATTITPALGYRLALGG